jgi:hypothetical protein
MANLPLTPTGERIHGLPVFRMGTPDRDAARGRRNRALDAMLSAASRGLPITREMEDEAHAAKVELFKAMGWGEPRLDNRTPREE